MNTVKSTLRGEVISRLTSEHREHTKPVDDFRSKLVYSLVLDVMEMNHHTYSHSVFKPECGLGDGVLTRQDLSDLLNLNHLVAREKENNVPLLRLLLEKNDVLKVRDSSDT